MGDAIPTVLSRTKSDCLGHNIRSMEWGPYFITGILCNDSHCFTRTHTYIIFNNICTAYKIVPDCSEKEKVGS